MFIFSTIILILIAPLNALALDVQVQAQVRMIEAAQELIVIDGECFIKEKQVDCGTGEEINDNKGDELLKLLEGIKDE